MIIETDKISERDKNIVKGNPSEVFYVAGVLVLLFVIWGAVAPGTLNRVAGKGLVWMIENFGWFYMLITAFFVAFSIFLAISPYGKIKLGKEDEEPYFSWISWVGMLFAAGIGVGFVFWGVAEPILYYLDPPQGILPETSQAAVAGIRYGAYHWAFHPWAIFSLVGLTLAYVQYKKGQPALISSAFYPLIGDRVNGVLGKIIDILAVIATSTGVATTFGLSAMQISGGLSHLTSIPNNALTQIIIIIIVTILFMFSAASGVDKGIKRLSNLNLGVAGMLLLFVIIVGPTVFIFESMVTTLGGYLTNLVSMSLTLTPFTDSGWLGRNTIFFWAWHISWAPFMGIFIARISEGRTIREFMAGVLLIPSALAIIWFSSFGGTALYVELFGDGGISELVTSQVELALFATLSALPFSGVTTILALILILIFFITSADSASYVLGVMTSSGRLNPKMWVKLSWGFLIAGTASVLLLSGGGGLVALQTASIITAFPFALIMIVMIVSVMMMLNADLKIINKTRREEIYDELKEEIYQEVIEELEETMENDKNKKGDGD